MYFINSLVCVWPYLSLVFIFYIFIFKEFFLIPSMRTTGVAVTFEFPWVASIKFILSYFHCTSCLKFCFSIWNWDVLCQIGNTGTQDIFRLNVLILNHVALNFFMFLFRSFEDGTSLLQCCKVLAGQMDIGICSMTAMTQVWNLLTNKNRNRTVMHL